MNGLIGLDIDGTITSEAHTINPAVVEYLEDLAKSGWALFFITGRPFSWGYEVLQHLSCPYYFCVQNGAITLEMPFRQVVAKKYLDSSILPVLDEICQRHNNGYILYTGYENDDICYYRPERLPKELVSYLDIRHKKLGENWVAVSSFDKVPVKEFASIKSFAGYEDALILSEAWESQLQLHAPIVNDPFNSDYYVIQGTRSDVSKGSALYDMHQKMGRRGLIIAAGDDNNDYSMMQVADIKIAMSDAPYELKKIADIIAPPCEENGIITGISRALEILDERGQL